VLLELGFFHCLGLRQLLLLLLSLPWMPLAALLWSSTMAQGTFLLSVMLLSLCFSLSLCDFVSFFFSFLPYVLAKSCEDFRVAGLSLFEVDCT
jgi:hypothetical protein